MEIFVGIVIYVLLFRTLAINSKFLRWMSLWSRLVPPTLFQRRWRLSVCLLWLLFAVSLHGGDPEQGIYFNIFNNLYDTNYILWYPWLANDSYIFSRFELSLWLSLLTFFVVVLVLVYYYLSHQWEEYIYIEYIYIFRIYIYIYF